MIFLQRRNIAFLCLALTACASPDPSRVQVTMMGTSGAGRANDMIARAGDSLEKIAQNGKINIGELLAMNGLVPAGTLRPGQKLTTPLPNEITVLEGDSVDTISRALGIEKAALVAANNLQAPYLLTRGQVLQIPQNASTGKTDMSTSPLAPPIQRDMPIASTPIVTTDSGAGQKIHSSATGTITEEDLAPPPSAKQTDSKAPLLKLPSWSDIPSVNAPQPPMQTASLTPPTATPPAPVAKPSAKMDPLPLNAPSFSWPVNGSTLSDFGPKADGQRNDGLTIGAPQGTTVRASAMGDVVYVGDNVAGFGNLILIRHGGGYATAYGHIQNPLVARGDRVAAGQAIAQVGKTGNAVTPQLHFEIRKGTAPVNPNSYLK